MLDFTSCLCDAICKNLKCPAQSNEWSTWNTSCEQGPTVLVWVWHLGDFSYIAVIDWWVGAFVWDHEGLVCRLLAHLPHDFYYLSSLVWQETKQLRYRASPDLMFQNHCSIGGFVNFSAPHWCLIRFCLPLEFLVGVYATGQWVNTSSAIIGV